MGYKLLQENFKDIISSIENEVSSVDVTEIPIAPALLEDSDLEVFLMPEVYNEYSRLLSLINDEKTAKEYPFILLGNYKVIDGSTFLVFEKFINGFTSDDLLHERIVNFDSDILTNAANNIDYSVISIGHTHPKLSDDLIINTLASNLSKNTRDTNRIRRAGLNLSVQDFVQYDSLREQITFKEVFQTILMYNGELNIIGNNNGKYYKFLNITGLGLEDDFKIPVAEYVGTRVIK